MCERLEKERKRERERCIRERERERKRMDRMVDSMETLSITENEPN